VQTPKEVVFLDRLPVTPIGKIDKKALRAELTARVD
jgi:non-ribosomal peptide synthetase component E (peptide arylation enzyme)